MVLVLLAASAAGCRDTPTRPADPSGRYVFDGTIAATLEIRADGDQYTVALAGGGSTSAGAAAAADCEVRAAGRRHGDTLETTFVAVDTPTFSYSAPQAQRERRELRLRFDERGVEVTRADVEGYCGLGASFTGRYRRAQ